MLYAVCDQTHDIDIPLKKGAATRELTVFVSFTKSQKEKCIDGTCFFLIPSIHSCDK